MYLLRTVALAVGLFFAAASAQAADEVTMIFSFGKAGKDAGVFVAMEKGYFKEAGIEISVSAGRGSGVAIATVESGNADFGVSDFGNIIASRTKGGGVRSVMLLYDLSPFAVASLADHLVLESPKSLEGHSIAAPQGSTIRVQLPVLFHRNNVDADAVKLVHMPGSAFIPTLLQGQVDVSSAFTNEVGVAMRIAAEKAGKSLSLLKFRDYGLDIYAVTILTSDRLIEENPDLVRRMVSALVRGYSDMVADPDEAARIMLKHVPELPEDVVAGQVRETVELAKTASFAKNGYGRADREKLEFTIDLLTQAMDIKERPATDEIHTNEFLPEQ